MVGFYSEVKEHFIVVVCTVEFINKINFPDLCENASVTMYIYMDLN
jgi:hypothetical protein